MERTPGGCLENLNVTGRAGCLCVQSGRRRPARPPKIAWSIQSLTLADLGFLPFRLHSFLLSVCSQLRVVGSLSLPRLPIAPQPFLLPHHARPPRLPGDSR